jgi:hypothetical protein
LDSVAAIYISRKRLDDIMHLWNEYLATLDKQSLIAHVTWQREKYSRSFYQKYNLLDVGKLFSDTLLLKRTMLSSSSKGRTLIDKEEDAVKILDLYDQLKEIEFDHLQVKSCYANMVYWKNFDLEKLTIEEMRENFKIVQNEKYVNLMKSYENYDLYTPEKGEEKLREYQPIFDSLTKGANMQPKNYSSEQFLVRFYDMISSLYLGFLRNRLQSYAFHNLKVYSEIINSPKQLTSFVNTFTFHPNGITVCPASIFLTRASSFFKKSPDELGKILLFDEKNPGVFPLFVRVKIEKENFDNVFISHAFTNLISLFLYPLIMKDVFDRETNKRSKEFEKAVEQEFKMFGFTYYPNQVDNKGKPTLEIDGLAIKDGLCYVIECKKRRLPALIEEDNVREYVIRDTKGIVEGIKYTTKPDGTTIQKKIPSILTKVEFVEKNNQRWKGQNTFNIVKPLIVTKDYPLISEYKGVRIIPFSRISNL